MAKVHLLVVHLLTQQVQTLWLLAVRWMVLRVIKQVLRLKRLVTNLLLWVRNLRLSRRILSLKVILPQQTKNQILQSVQVQLQMVQDNLKHLVIVLKKQQVLHYLVVLKAMIHVQMVPRLP